MQQHNGPGTKPTDTSGLAGCLFLQDLPVAPTEDRVQRYWVHSMGGCNSKCKRRGRCFGPREFPGRGRVQAEMGRSGCFRRKKC